MPSSVISGMFYLDFLSLRETKSSYILKIGYFFYPIALVGYIYATFQYDLFYETRSGYILIAFVIFIQVTFQIFFFLMSSIDPS